MKSFTPEEWMKQARNIYELIISEIEQMPPEFLPSAYPKFVVMYEFFRFLRGEAFTSFRIPMEGHGQKELYDMEYDLKKRLDQLRAELPSGDESVSYHLDQMKRSFDLS